MNPTQPSKPRFSFTRGEWRALLVLAALLLIGLVAQQVRRAGEAGADTVIVQGAQPLEEKSLDEGRVGDVSSSRIDSPSLDDARSGDVTSSPKVPEASEKGDAAPPGARDGVATRPISGQEDGASVSRDAGLVSPINVNTADLKDLVALPGIGPVLAQRILDWRRDHGAFRTVDDLMLIKGIGEKRLAKLRPLVTIGP